MTFAAHENKNFKNWGEYSQFIELKNRRNEFTHPTVPAIKYEPKEMVKYLNFASTGVGNLLAKMRLSSNETDKIGFISQIRTLPIIRIDKESK